MCLHICYLLLVILRDVAEELTSLPKKDILLTELFLQELLQHQKIKKYQYQSLSCEFHVWFYIVKKTICVRQSSLTTKDITQ